MHRSLVALAGLFSAAAPAFGQQSMPSADSHAVRVPRWQVGLAADVGQPLGDFKRNVKNAAGAQAHAVLRLDRRGLVSLRMQGGWLNYGHESERTCLGAAAPCRVTVDVTTANGIFSLALGPQFAASRGRVLTYGYALAGMSRFATLSGLGGGLLPDMVAADENFGDGGMMWSGGVGLQLAVHRGISIDIGARYERHGTRDYLVEGGLTNQPDGSLGFDIKRSQADLYAIRIGLTTAIGRGPRRSAQAP